MKNIVYLIVSIFILASCSSNLEDLNKNIKDPLEVPGETLFTGAVKSLADQIVDLNVNNNNTKLWAQYLQETTYTDESNYDQLTRNIPEEHWKVLFRDVIKDLDEAAIIIEATTYSTPELQSQKANNLQIIELVEIFAYSLLIETFGDVPYKESIDIENLLPAYDDGLTVYKDLIVRLDVVIANLDTSNSNSLSSGINTDVAGWKKFAASLKLRMGILLSDVDPTLSKSTVESAITDGVFTSSADNIVYEYLSADPNTNPIHSNLVLSGRHDFVAAKTITDIMNTLDDPRRPLYFLDVEGVYIGGSIGSTSGYASHSHVSAQVEAATTDGVILDFAEVQFLLAEAAAREYTVGGTAKEFYDSAIEASIEIWGGSSDDITDYLANPLVDFDTAMGVSTAAMPWKEVIGTQKWIALFNRGLEGWTSIRLLDFPEMTVPEEAVSGFPNRYTYPVIEQTLNKTNWSAASSNIGGDEAETKLFWDLN